MDRRVAIIIQDMLRYLFTAVILAIPIPNYLAGYAISSDSCIDYESSDKEIIISCNSANLSEIYNQIGHESILHKQGDAGVWFLEANLLIKRGATLHINSSDTQWLKISSDGSHAFRIIVEGSLRIDSTKITSWNNEEGGYGQLDGEQTDSPRPFIRISSEASGTTDITNSEIAYLGYDGDKRSGLNYYAGNGSIIKGNDIHHLWRGFYSKGVQDIQFENNRIFNNYEYGIDPHSKTSNMIISNNNVYNNGGQGIICSLDCFNITIKDNQVYRNEGSGIMFSRGMSNSNVQNNTVYDESECIFISNSNHNLVSNNIVNNCENAIYLKAGSLDNTIYNNTIQDSHDGIVINSGADNNTIYANTIVDTIDPIKVELDRPTNNIISNNTIIY